MFDIVSPVLPLLLICHAWMTFMLVGVVEDEEVAVLSPECFPV